MREALQALLIEHEGLRLMPYVDTVGKLTIGVGRNLTDKGVSEPEALLLLDHDLDECSADLAAFPWFARLNAVRQMALIDLRFNLGAAGFRGFTHMMQSLSIEDYRGAAAALQDSKWFTQVGRRGKALVSMLATGVALLLLCAAPAFAQVDVVAKYRNQYPTPLSADQKVTLLRQIAGEVHGGLILKRDRNGNPEGTNCGGYSCDSICFSDVTLFDVLQDQDNAALPRWDPTTNPRGYRCELVGTPNQPPVSPAPSPQPPTQYQSVPSLDLAPIVARLDSLYAQNERIYADLTHQHADQTAQIVAAVNEPAFIKKFFSNTYVQLALASFASVYATHQVMK